VDAVRADTEATGDAHASAELFEVLMGNDVGKRRQYLLDNSDAEAVVFDVGWEASCAFAVQRSPTLA
jgi:uncharacterized phage-like protein YoqJ